MSTTHECETAVIENEQHAARHGFEPLHLHKSPNIHGLETGATVNDDKTNAQGSAVVEGSMVM